MLVLELTAAGWAAIWEWVKDRSHDPQAQDEVHWYKHALRSINLIPAGEQPVVCMRGSVSRSGYLEGLRLQPDWYRRMPRVTIELTPL